MAIQVFICPRRHETEKVFTPTQKLPKWISCPKHMSMTHSPGCAKFHQCRARALRQTVYRVGVGGDLPTRGAF